MRQERLEPRSNQRHGTARLRKKIRRVGARAVGHAEDDDMADLTSTVYTALLHNNNIQYLIVDAFGTCPAAGFTLNVFLRLGPTAWTTA